MQKCNKLRMKFVMLLIYWKKDFDVKISDIKEKYFTISDHNKFRIDITDASDISNLAKNCKLSTKFATFSTKAEIKAEQDKKNWNFKRMV